MKKVLVTLAGLGLSASVFAAPPDFAPIAAAFSSDSIVTGILAVGAIVAVVYTAMRGARMVLSMIRG